MADERLIPRFRIAGMRRRPPGEARPVSLDWPAWIALLERYRRQIHRGNGSFQPSPPDFFISATCASFRIEDIDCSEQEVIDAITPNTAQRKFRSRAAQRVRNHVAILHSIETALRSSLPLKSASALRWYTSIGSGLSTTSLGVDKMARLDRIVGRINSPQLRLQPAIQEIYQTYIDVLADPIFHSFNGILARLLLRFHLGRCGLPAVTFEEFDGRPRRTATDAGLLSLLGDIEQGYQMILGYNGGG